MLMGAVMVYSSHTHGISRLPSTFNNKTETELAGLAAHAASRELFRCGYVTLGPGLSTLAVYRDMPNPGPGPLFWFNQTASSKQGPPPIAAFTTRAKKGFKQGPPPPNARILNKGPGPGFGMSR